MTNANAATFVREKQVGPLDRLANVRAKPKLLDRLRQALRSRHYSRRTEQTYCCWVKHVGCHTFRHSFATHLLEAGYDIRTIQENFLGTKTSARP